MPLSLQEGKSLNKKQTFSYIALAVSFSEGHDYTFSSFQIHSKLFY